jgi:hypothetical protein
MLFSRQSGRQWRVLEKSIAVLLHLGIISALRDWTVFATFQQAGQRQNLICVSNPQDDA